MHNTDLATTWFNHPQGKNQPLPLSNLMESLKTTLDSVLTLQPWHAMEFIRSKLFSLQRSASREQWKALMEEVVLHHPTMELCHKDPFTRRAFKKPRGYAGDAVMIDYVNGFRNDVESSDTVGVIVSNLSFNAPSVKVVRNRLYYIVNRIDVTTTRRDNVEIMSVACGHCRELSMLAPSSLDNVSRFVAMDHGYGIVSLRCK